MKRGCKWRFLKLTCRTREHTADGIWHDVAAKGLHMFLNGDWGLSCLVSLPKVFGVLQLWVCPHLLALGPTSKNGPAKIANWITMVPKFCPNAPSSPKNWTGSLYQAPHKRPPPPEPNFKAMKMDL